ncbi:MAG: DNA polymerase III subunit beta [Rhodospirillales bacterium]|nr:DNA polymerase III subunit beta [Rhodospirillales bacterium]QQS10563.1 MAG: DNA polymerase III subunit beta [Rhodospirillales bacterium]
MKLTIERAALLKALAHVQSVVERRNTIPILSNVMLTAQKSRLGLAATDMDLAIVENVEAVASKPGSTTAPAHTMYEIVRKLPDGAQVEIETGTDSNLTIRAGRSRFTLQCLPVGDFPQMNDGDLPHRFQLSAAEMKGLIDRTRFAISTEETRYYLNGIYVHATKSDGVDVMRGVATDGHRLARVELPLPAGAADMPGVIVPRKTVNELRKLIDEADGAVDVELSETKIRFTLGGVTLTSKLIDGTFPDYERVIPSGNDKELVVPRAEFAAAVDRVATISTEKSRAIKLSASKNNLTLSATSPDAGSATEEIEIGYAGPPIEIGFNSRYLLDITAQITGGDARFLMADSGSPTVVRDTADPGALYVLMPMRV